MAAMKKQEKAGTVNFINVELRFGEVVAESHTSTTRELFENSFVNVR